VGGLLQHCSNCLLTISDELDAPCDCGVVLSQPGTTSGVLVAAALAALLLAGAPRGAAAGAWAAGCGAAFDDTAALLLAASVLPWPGACLWLLGAALPLPAGTAAAPRLALLLCDLLGGMCCQHRAVTGRSSENSWADRVDAMWRVSCTSTCPSPVPTATMEPSQRMLTDARDPRRAHSQAVCVHNR
jgi:hypothetical protein